MVGPPTPSSDARRAFDDVLDDCRGLGVREAQMMGRPMIALERRMVACLERDALAVRLGRDTDAHAEAMAVPGAEPFAPGGGDTRFADWVAIPVAHADRWTPLVEAAVERLRSSS